MMAVKSSLEDADIALLMVDIREDLQESDAVFQSLKLKVPALVVLNKADLVKDGDSIQQKIDFFATSEILFL